MDIILAIFAFLVAVFILVLAHEYGHFLAARLVGIKVLRFAIGYEFSDVLVFRQNCSSDVRSKTNSRK